MSPAGLPVCRFCWRSSIWWLPNFQFLEVLGISCWSATANAIRSNLIQKSKYTHPGPLSALQQCGTLISLIYVWRVDFDLNELPGFNHLVAQLRANQVWPFDLRPLNLHAVLEQSRKAHSHIRSWTLAARQGQFEFSPFQTSRDSVSLTSRLSCLSFLTCPCLPRTRSRLRSTYTLSCLVGRIRTDVDRPKRGIDGWLSPLFASRLMCEDNQLAILNQLQRTSSPEAQAFYWSSDKTERSNIQKHPSQLPDTHKSLWGYNLCRGSKIFVSASLKFSGFFGASISLFLLCFLAWK